MGSKQRYNDQENLNVLEVLDILLKKADREWVSIRAIVISPDLVAENYVFVTETGNMDFYILVNQKDWDRAIAQYEMANIDKEVYVDPYILAREMTHDCVVTDDKIVAQKAICGVFKWTYELRQGSLPR